MDTNIDIGTDQIKEWRSIVTLIIFFFAKKKALAMGIEKKPRNLFLIAILAIGKKEVKDGTLGDNGIFPLDIMVFFITLAYIAISIDASGLIRYLALKVLQWGGKVGHRLFFYLYAFFFGLGSFIGNDPIILSGTAFLAYMTRVSNNIKHPRAWIFTQFAIANIASAILVSSNPTNLVLAGAFNIKFIDYTANMVVPVVITALVLFPFLLYIVFANEGLIPVSIEMRELPTEAKSKPVNPNIPNARGTAAEDEEDNNTNGNEGKLLSLVEIMNPFLDKKGAAFGAFIMAVTLITVLAINAASVKTKNDEHFQVFWVTLPAAFVMLCWDLAFGWINREETREIARKGRQELERARVERALREEARTGRTITRGGRRSTECGTEMFSTAQRRSSEAWPEIHVQDADAHGDADADAKDGLKSPDDESPPLSPGRGLTPLLTLTPAGPVEEGSISPTPASSPRLDPSMSTAVGNPDNSRPPSSESTAIEKPNGLRNRNDPDEPPQGILISGINTPVNEKQSTDFEERPRPDVNQAIPRKQHKATLVSLCKDGYRWSQETFPTVMAVVSHLPFALVPFAFAMFVLVQALVTKGWVPVFAYGWDHWVEKTGTIGAIGGMGFLSVILCNFAGTNIGTTILLSRVIQAWQEIHRQPGSDPISDRTFWATVYSMALGVNYGAFSTAFSASLAGLLWRDILERKHIHVRRMEFARVNVPIIAIAMTVGCTVLVGEIYIIRNEGPYHL
ncbi:putative arsenite efflux transporter [Colletotrichum karsti]|uniref:Arsenite efflux transporter n=1 Tax=Colletotrichum karsti TaxID=1095194 RepID=A0A9P6LHN6_9PEZI|nr:putative arsenite efflux transporter [Colletotrichum karsti]KAF9873778.1 putative arsenite efflux transporter [Colletotrichum karsti]